MKTIAIVNLKGGVAKTTTTITIAAILAGDYGKRVLVVDADSQCNTTEFLGADPAQGNLAEVLRAPDGEGALADISIQPTTVRGVDILAGAESLMDLDLTKVETGTVRATVLRDMVARLIEGDRYDYCIIDCPPAFNAASAAALIAADEVVIPIKLDAFSLRGMVNLTRQISNMRAINPGLRIAGYLPVMWYRDDAIARAEATLCASGLRVFPHIRRTDKVDGMTFAQEPITIYSPRSAAGVDYRRFVRDYIGGALNG